MGESPESAARSSYSFAELLQKARAGDQAALDQLLAERRPFLKLLVEGLIGRQLRSRLDSSDVVQESLVAGLQGFKDFRGQTEAELRAWLKAIAHRALLNAARREQQQCRDVRLQQTLPQDADGGVGLAADSTSPSNRAVHGEELEQLRRVLKALPADYKQVLSLVRLELKSWPEVARQMNRSELAVKRLFYRALDRLKAVMEPSDES